MQTKRPIFNALLRGFVGKCPNCGQGKLFRAYLKQVDQCAVCHEEYAGYRADDGPAYFTILIVGHLVLAPLLFIPWMWEASPWIVLPTVMIALAVISLVLLQRVKGAFIALLWSHANKGDEHGPGSELAASERRA
jgi:uncharacterized protein (DUF983 family)